MNAIYSKRLNFEAVLKIFILLGFAGFFEATIQSGTVQLYVHPRILPYMKFGTGVFILISLFFVGELFKPKKRNANLYKYLIFILPLILFFLVPPKTADAGAVSFGRTKITASSDEDGQNINTPGNSDTVINMFNNRDNGLELKEDTILMEENNFIRWIQEMQINIDKYEGKKIEMTGFVFKDAELKEDQFVLARLMMSCCAADAQPVGLLAGYAGTGELKKDEWIKVWGTVKKGEYNGQVMPVVHIERVEKTEKPKIEYIYP